MANTVTLKRSSVAGKIPQTSDLSFGEVALNFTDGRLYFRNSNNEIQFFDSGRKTEILPPLAANEGDFGNVTDDSLYSFDLGKVTSSKLFDFDLGDLESEEFLVFESDLNLGKVTGSTKKSYNLGSVTGITAESYDLGSVVTNTLSFPERFILPQATVSSLTDGIAGEMRFVTDDINGPAPAFYDGTNWKRLSDSQPITQSYISDGYVEDGYV